MPETIDVLNLFRFPAGSSITTLTLPENFRLHAAPREASPERDKLLDEIGPKIRAILTGTGGTVDEALLEKLPNLEVISCYSAGLDPIDVPATELRRIILSNNSPALADSVAEMGIALLISLARGVVGADRYVREGKWLQKRYGAGHLLRGRKMGIVGLGHIGTSVARKAEAFGIEIAYHGRHEQKDKPFRYFARLLDLAQWADTLMLTCPGGEETFHLINAAVLKALGSGGYIVNMARGTVIDEQALVAALAEGTIAGAGLDVFEKEPEVPRALLASDKVVLSPHQGSSTVEITPYRVKYFVDTLINHFDSGNARAAAR